MSRARLGAFRDGVFAIAITLLIIEIRPPHSEPGRLAHDLADLWPAYASYAVSFAIIGIIWVNHHQMFDRTMVGPVVYALSIGVTFISAVACLIIYAVMAIYFMLDIGAPDQPEQPDSAPEGSPPRSVSTPKR